jgi:glucose-1-phosphate cytidylyltransferase
MIKEYFANNNENNWDITFLDTGQKTDTGGRIKRAAQHIDNQTFMLTYGDGLADINLIQLLSFHQKHGGLATMTSVQLASRFGILEIGDKERVTQFKEKPKKNEAWINGGYFICEPGILNYIKNDETIFEKNPLQTLANNRELFTYRHRGFWKCMDTLRDKRELDELAKSDSPPWVYKN